MDGYLSIGEAARLTGISVKAIRHYANEQVVAPSAVSESGYRMYDPADVWRLTLVRLLREMEFGLPEIRKIMARSPDIPAVLQWQKEILDMQIAHLTTVRTQLEQIPPDVWGTASLTHLHTILEAMKMSSGEKQSWLQERWSQAMIPEDAPADWRDAFLQQLKDSLPTEWGVEQAAAWADLQAFLNDERYRNELQETVRPFWQMLERRPMEPGAWNESMERLMGRAVAAYASGCEPGSAEVQTVVDEWIDLFAKAMRLPVDDVFLERFAHYSEQVGREPNQRLWQIMIRLNPGKMKASYEAQQLMLEGLRWRRRQSHG